MNADDENVLRSVLILSIFYNVDQRNDNGIITVL